MLKPIINVHRIDRGLHYSQLYDTLFIAKCIHIQACMRSLQRAFKDGEKITFPENI